MLTNRITPSWLNTPNVWEDKANSHENRSKRCNGGKNDITQIEKQRNMDAIRSFLLSYSIKGTDKLLMIVSASGG